MTIVDKTGNHKTERQGEDTGGGETKARPEKKSRLRQWLKALIPLSVLPLLFLFAWGLGKDPKLIPTPLIGKEAPDFTLPLFDGGTVRLQELRGKVVVLNFWASWCYPACWNEAPRLEAAWQRYKDRGVMLIGVNYQDREEDARQFIRRFRKSYPNGPDVGSKISIDYGVYGVPETFFLDREGKIAFKQIGEISMETLTQQIERLLATGEQHVQQTP